MFEFIKKIYRHIIVVSILVLSAVLSCTRYKIALVCLWASIKDLFFSLKYYFLFFFNESSEVTVTQLPDSQILKLLPYDVDELFRKFAEMWSYVFNGDCFVSYFNAIGKFLENFMTILTLALPFVLIFAIVFKDMLLKPNEDRHGEKTRFLQFFERSIIPLWQNIVSWIKSVFAVFSLKRYMIVFVVLWLINLNIITVVIEFLAYYFYFAFSIDLLNLPVQLVKLLLDVIIMLSGAPIIFWLIVAYIILRLVAKNIGYTRLDHREAVNRELIGKQSLLIMNTGPMGNGKTTGAADMSISANIMFRNKALELMLECYSKFPNFKWILFEDYLKKCIEHHQIYNLTTARDIIDLRKARFEKNVSSDGLFEYDLELYRTSFDDALEIKDIFDVLSDYACLYLSYIVTSSLIIANISVRDDSELSDKGNFPLWSNELFRLSPELSEARSKYAHIIDYDALRLGRKLIEDNPHNGSFEFGVILLTEIGKERGNNLTLQEVKKGDDKTNQKNDLFSYSMKMIRHKATIMNYCFARVFMDEQRPESLGADLRDLLTILHIREKSSPELLLPFFFVEEIIHDFIYSRYTSFLVQYRYNRGDDCFPVWLLRNVVERFHNYYVRMYNTFGCSTLTIDVERGTMDGSLKKEKYYLCSKKIYSNRFSTDCYRGFFEDELRKTKVGIEDYPTYKNTVADSDELHRQNSYFISDMEKIEKGIN